MDVYMEVERVRGGGGGLRTIAPEARRASERVQAPAENAASSNGGFFTGAVGVDWQSALSAVTEGLERRVAWQGEQVSGSADDMDGCDREAGGRFRDIGRELPRRRRD
ncbi:hypothetical protein [Glycomyces arizonensis]|uniref:hypothetical protein n=1 Tax=Glycomyces arizonensis TaxID=256035 RepID=UPI00040EA520|nr:hypothetical protein [Glycomyces arizonensis]